MQVHTERPLFLCKSFSQPSDSKMRILPWAMCQGGHFLQPWMTGGFSAGLNWSRLSEGQRGSLQPGWKEKRIPAIEWLWARLRSRPSPPKASLLSSHHAAHPAGSPVQEELGVRLCAGGTTPLGSVTLSTAVLVSRAKKKEPASPFLFC